MDGTVTRGRGTVDQQTVTGESGRLIGTVEYRDQIRPESRAVIRTLRNRGTRCIMLTGDNQRIATAVARELALDEVYSGVLPSEKAEIVRRLQAQGRLVAMVGDGMNDTAALAYADVGIAMHGGADVARASADVVLIDGSLWNIVTSIDLAERAVGLIQQNWQITAAANALAFLLAIPAGAVSPFITALLSNGSAILAGVNAARPLWS